MKLTSVLIFQTDGEEKVLSALNSLQHSPDLISLDFYVWRNLKMMAYLGNLLHL
jgi:hypothetical protein